MTATLRMTGQPTPPKKKIRPSSISKVVLLVAGLLQLPSTQVADARASRARRLPAEGHAPSSVAQPPWEEMATRPLSAPIVPSVDFCALAASASQSYNGIIPYNLAKGCYEQFPFDAQIRDDTVRNVRANLESFYVFYDIAKSPPSMENSDLEPVDLSSDLDILRNTAFPNDYSFHASLGRLIARLQDPHTSYKNMCYQQFLFLQPISTYGVFEDGRQQVKVATVLRKLDSRLDKSLVDCEVTHIDGRPAFEVMTEYAKTKPYSKDRGVRLNKAFSYLAHDRTGSSYDRYALGTFAQRTKIPVNATIEYKIECAAPKEDGTLTTSSITLDLAWSALDATMLPFEDSASYYKQFCTKESIQTVKKFVLDSANADDFSTGSIRLHGGRTKSRELFRGPYASFHLLNDGITAVFRLGTESPNKSDSNRHGFYNNIDRGFASMEAAGATKLIIDLQNNSGGIICWGRYVLQTLFPQTVDAPYIYNLRSSRLAQALARATFAFDQDITSPYEGLVDPITGEEVEDDTWMIPGVNLPGREGRFSQKVTDRYCPAVDDVKGSQDEGLFQPENMILLTNGFCGSTCAVLALQLHERYGVRTVAIGGHHNQSMAFTSFPGGAVQANNTQWVDRVQDVFATLPDAVVSASLDTLVPERLPANGQLAFTFRQVMSVSKPEQVAEYMRIPSEFRMDYTSARFRMPSILWDDVRQEVWGDMALSEDEEEDEASQPVQGSEAGLVEGYEADVENEFENDLELEQAAKEADLEDMEWMKR